MNLWSIWEANGWFSSLLLLTTGHTRQIYSLQIGISLVKQKDLVGKNCWIQDLIMQLLTKLLVDDINEILAGKGLSAFSAL